MEEGPRTLKSLFADAETRREALEGTYEASSPGYREALVAAIRDYEECLELVSKLGIFSPNESADDIATSNVPYLLVHYHLADNIQKLPTTSPLERKRTLTSARTAYEGFLRLLDGYGLLSAEQVRLFERYTDDPGGFSTTAAGGDPVARRNFKIANFKAEKDLRARVAHLRRRRQQLHDVDGGEDDDEVVRETHLALVAYCAHMAFQALEGLNREEEVLAQAPMPLLPQTTSVEEDDEARRRAADSSKNDGYMAGRLDRPLRRLQSAVDGPLLSREGKPLQPFTIVGTRADVAQGVFRPGHSLPTMSIDEYLAEERRRGGIIDGGGETSLRQAEPDEDNMELADAETVKARAWDEFKEANPRGAGNTMNRG